MHSQQFNASALPVALSTTTSSPSPLIETRGFGPVQNVRASGIALGCGVTLVPDDDRRRRGRTRVELVRISTGGDGEQGLA